MFSFFPIYFLFPLLLETQQTFWVMWFCGQLYFSPMCPSMVFISNLERRAPKKISFASLALQSSSVRVHLSTIYLFRLHRALCTDGELVFVVEDRSTVQQVVLGYMVPVAAWHLKWNIQNNSQAELSSWVKKASSLLSINWFRIQNSVFLFFPVSSLHITCLQFCRTSWVLRRNWRMIQATEHPHFA